MNTQSFIAHVDSEGNTQSLEDHAGGVAQLCREFCAQIDPSWQEVGTILGLLHDQGKYQQAFQSYIRYASGLADHGPSRAPHSMAGAIQAYTLLKHQDEPLARTLAYCIGGHHRGLYDSGELEQALNLADNKAYHRNMLHDAPEANKALSKRIAQLDRLPDIMDIDEEDRPLLVRMLFSALVDADYLDTERFMDYGRAHQREESKRLDTSWTRLRDKLRERTDSFDTEGAINQARAYFLDKCRSHGAQCDPGIYSLFLPTGGGKTLSSMAWALEVAIRHQASRIIYVIPYTSIITQTAEIFKRIFGDEYILEHHSELDLSDDELYDRNKLLAENWDAPIVITTNVQMFESLYSNRTSRCRKLHNICQSVVVFDEVQMFPTGYLNPMLRAIESLSMYFGASILLCTATQPVFTQTFDIRGRGANKFYAIAGDEKGEIEDVVPYNRERFSAFDRVQYHLPVVRWTTAQLATEIYQHPSALCIVNTRADAGAIYDAVIALGREPSEVVHLSRSMCSLHIRKQIAYIKERLAKGLPILTISTQLIEAGVDIDFPIVYRAHSGLDSIIQAGGRCNREGKQSRGDVYIFELEDGSKPWGEVNQGRQAANIIYKSLAGETLNPNAPDLIRRYYMQYYGYEVNSFDKGHIEKLLWSPQARRDLELDFETASNNFRLIDDRDVVDVYVPYGEEGERIIQKLSQRSFLVREEFRTLQRLRIGVRQRDFEALVAQGVVAKVQLGTLSLWIVTYGAQCYDEVRGLKCHDIWTNDTLTQ